MGSPGENILLVLVKSFTLLGSPMKLLKKCYDELNTQVLYNFMKSN